MDGNAVKHVNEGAALDAQIFDDIEAIHFTLAGGETREIPTFRRSWTAETMSAINRSVPIEYTVNSSNGRAAHEFELSQGAVNGHGAKLAEMTTLAKRVAKKEYEILEIIIESRQQLRITGRAVGKIDAIQARTPGAPGPALNGIEADVEASRDSSHREPMADEGDNVAAQNRRRFFGSRLAFQWSEKRR